MSEKTTERTTEQATNSEEIDSSSETITNEVLKQGNDINGVVEGEIIESIIISGCVNRKIKDGDMSVYLFEFPESDRVFPVCSSELLHGNKTVFFSSSNDVQTLHDISRENVEVVDVPEDNSEHYAVGHIVEQDGEKYCVVTNVSDRKEVAMSKLDNDISSIKKEGYDGFVFSTVECNIVPGGVDSTMYESSIDYDKMSYIRNVVKEHKVCIHRPIRDTVYEYEDRLTELIPEFISEDRSFMSSVSLITEIQLAVTTGVLCLTAAGYLSSVQNSTALMLPLPVLLILSTAMVMTAAGLSGYGLLLGTYNRYSLIDPDIVKQNTVETTVPDTADSTDAEEVNSVSENNTVDSVTLKIDAGVDTVNASGEVDGIEETWVWERDSTGDLPGTAQKLIKNVPVYDDEIVVTVREVTGEIDGEGDESVRVLCSESENWMICEEKS